MKLGIDMFVLLVCELVEANDLKDLKDLKDLPYLEGA